MFVAVITPAEPVVSVDEAKAHLRVDFDDDDDLIEGLVAAATATLDGPDGVLGRALGTQALEATLEGFPGARHLALGGLWHSGFNRERHGVPLRCAPVQSIVSVEYLDANGDPQTLPDTVYELTADGRLRLKFGQCWPQTQTHDAPVTVSYVAGYEVLPPPLRAAILLLTGDLYENREGQVISETRATSITNATVERLLGPFYVRRA
jgi:hypothetical protein